ncbi:polysaccharide biosynthesis/export family protein [bacterium]|nr:polysaccharide biosynthesis/export family protein [bacterium]
MKRLGARRFFPAAVLVLFAAGFAFAQDAKPASPYSYTAPEYRIGPGDQIDVNVWDNPQVSKPVTVRPDGRLTLPLAGEINAAGMTLDELRARLEEALKRYIEKPVVSLTLLSVESYKVFVQGQVRNAGAYPINGTTTVTQAVSLAGGFTEFANPNGVFILRGGAATTQKIRVKYKRILAGKALDVAVQPGDTVVVP